MIIKLILFLVLLAVCLPGCAPDSGILTPDQVDISTADQAIKLKTKWMYSFNRRYGITIRPMKSLYIKKERR